MKDDYTKVDISKKDIVTKEELPGATLQIKDSNGSIIEEWVSSTEPHRINRLPVGDYIIVEKQAPNGYLIAEKVKFTVTETGEIQKAEMFDAKDVSLYVKKNVSNVEKLNGDEEFTIKVSGEFADGTNEKYIKFAYDELGKEKPVMDVIYGNEYKISEPQHDGYTVKIDKESVILMESKELVTVTNTLDIPDIPDIPEKPDTPDNPGSPEGPEKPDTPDNPGSPEEPEKPDTPNNPGSPEEPEKPDTPDDSGNPEEPDKPDAPDNSGQPDASSKPNPPNNSSKSDDLKDGDDVQTGDSSLTNEVVIGSIALIALVVLWINDKRRKNL